MSVMTTSASRIAEIEEHIKAGQISEVENIWMEAAGEGVSDARPYLTLADTLAKAGHRTKAAALLELLAEPLLKDNRPEAACTVISRAAEIDSSSPSLKDTARKVYGARFSDVDGFEDVVSAAEQDSPGDPSKFVARLHELCSFKIGDYLFHDAGWGLGKVVGLNLRSRRLTIDFEDTPGHEVDLAAATRFFRKLPKDHLVARMAESVDLCKEQAKTDPTGLMRCVMQSLDGKVTLKRVKDTLVPGVISKTAWTKWWADVKKELTGGGVIRVGAGNNPTLELLHVPTSLEEEFSQELAACHTTAEFAVTLRRYFRESNGRANRAEFLTKQIQVLFNRLSVKERPLDGEKVLAKYLLDEAQQIEPGVELRYDLDLTAIALDAQRVLALLPGIEITDYQQRCLSQVREHHPDWKKVFADALLINIPSCWDSIVEALREAEGTALVNAAARKIHDDGPGYPEQLLWLSRRVIVEEFPSAFDITVSRAQMFIEILNLGMSLFHRIEKGERRAQKLLHKFRAVLAERNNRIAQVVIDECDEEQARHLLHKLNMNRGLSDAHLDNILAIVNAKFPNLMHVEKATSAFEDEETGLISTTPAGLRKRRKELSDILNVEMPEVQKAIGEALALGDISENAELDVARAKEDQLKNRAARIGQELDRVRVMLPKDVDATAAGFGMRATLNNVDTGTLETYTILGRWDADSERGVISDISAIGRGIAGMKTGERRSFKTPDGATVTFELKAIELAQFDAE